MDLIINALVRFYICIFLLVLLSLILMTCIKAWCPTRGIRNNNNRRMINITNVSSNNFLLEKLRLFRSKESSPELNEVDTEIQQVELEPEQFIMFQKEMFKKITILGKGNFGVVNLYEVLNNEALSQKFVAIKELKEECGDAKNEFELLVQCNHENIVKCFGYFENLRTNFIIMEFLNDGNFKDYLDDLKNILSLPLILNYIKQVINGMCYLNSRRIIHRDLAARNCLLSDEKRVIKIGDFGLGRQLRFDADYYPIRDVVNFQFPFCWTALECLNGFPFSEKSDVWSFGVLFWEVFARQKKPYEEFETYHHILEYLKDGGRLVRHKECPNEIFKTVFKCWNSKPSNRPSFKDLNLIFNNIWADSPSKKSKPNEELPVV